MGLNTSHKSPIHRKVNYLLEFLFPSFSSIPSESWLCETEPSLFGISFGVVDLSFLARWFYLTKFNKEKQVVTKFVLVANPVSSCKGAVYMHSAWGPGRKGGKKEFQRQINESKQREVKLGRPLGTRWRVFTGQIRGFVFSQRIRVEGIARINEKAAQEFVMKSAQTDPPRTSSGKKWSFIILEN